MFATENRNIKLLLLFIITLGAIIRLKGVLNGLPFFIQIEEGLVNNIILNLKFSGPNPHDFIYPGFIYYFFFPLFFCFKIFLPAISVFFGLGDYYAYIFLGRMVMVTFGLVNIVLLYLIAKKLFDHYTALIAALFLALEPMSLAWSFTFKPDTLMCTFVLLSFLSICRLFSGDRRKSVYILIGIFIGLATATKYNAVLIIAPFLAAHFFSLKDKKHFMDKNLILTVSTAILSFFVFNPFIILDFPAFLSDLKGEFYRARYGFHLRMADYLGWIRYPLIISEVLGQGILILSICGLIQSIIRPSKKNFLILSFPFLYYIIMGFSRNNPAHYALPLIPFALILAARFLKGLITAAGNFGFGKARTWIMVLAVFGFILPTIQKTIYYMDWVNQPDTRIMARNWIRENIAPESRLLLDVFSPANPIGIVDIGQSYKIDAIKWGEKKDYTDFFSKNHPDYIIVICISGRPASEMALYDYINRNFPLVKEIKPVIPRPARHSMYHPLYHSVIRIYDARKHKL